MVLVFSLPERLGDFTSQLRLWSPIQNGVKMPDWINIPALIECLCNVLFIRYLDVYILRKMFIGCWVAHPVQRFPGWYGFWTTAVLIGCRPLGDRAGFSVARCSAVRASARLVWRRFWLAGGPSVTELALVLLGAVLWELQPGWVTAVLIGWRPRGVTELALVLLGAVLWGLQPDWTPSVTELALVLLGAVLWLSQTGRRRFWLAGGPSVTELALVLLGAVLWGLQLQPGWTTASYCAAASPAGPSGPYTSCF